MDKISIKMTDLTGRTGETSKAGTTVKAATDDFKKLLQDQGQKEDSKEVSKDTKTEKKPESPKDEKDTKDVKDPKDDAVKEEEPKEDKSKTEGLLAAYQMAQGFRPEVIQVEPEAAEEIMMPEVQMVVAEPQEVLVQAEEAVIPEVQTAAEIQTEPVKMTEAETRVQQPEAEAAPQKEIKVEASAKDEASSDTKQEDLTQTGSSYMAEQAAAAPEAPADTQVHEVRTQEPVRMHVPEPEQLPEKLTEQLISKMSDGVQEFEIHIEPANLGKIAVKILYQEGQATVSILCSEKKALDVLGRNAGEIGQVIDKNLGGTTTIIVEKPESDYLNQTRDENQKNGQNEEQGQQKSSKKDSDAEDAEQFLQKLRLGLAG